MNAWDPDAYDREILAARRTARRSVLRLNGRPENRRMGVVGRERATDEELTRRRLAARAIERQMRRQHTREGM